MARVAPKRSKLSPGRPGFSEWLSRFPEPNWGVLPLTHITRGVIAEDIMREGKITPVECKVFNEALAYFFYGRPAYRVSGAGVVKAEAFCPFCFIFTPSLIDRAKAIHAFDTGAFSARMYANVLPDEMEVSDFRLDDASTVNQLISAVFGSQTAYLDGDLRAVANNGPKARPHEFYAKAYIDLVLSPGRNEPDDRIYSIEVICGDPVPLVGCLLAVVVPHTLWSPGGANAPWLEHLASSSVKIVPYDFMPGRPPEHYHTLLERAVKNFYLSEGLLK